MNFLQTFREFFSHKKRTRGVALVLSGGGARGFAHIGAIEVLEERGYPITSISGTSIGALVGGLYAAGKFRELKERVLGLDRKKVLQILNVSLGLDHIFNGDGLMKIMDGLLSEERIEDLPLPFCCCASDVVSGEKKVFRNGPLALAIRASISIPCFFKPVEEGRHIYVDGGVHDVLPLDCVERRKSDLLVAVNVSGRDRHPCRAYLKKLEGRTDAEKRLLDRFSFPKVEFSENYLNMALRVARLSVQNNAQMALRLCPPDIYMEVPTDQFGVFDFEKGQEIINYGRVEMTRQLDAYEARQ